MFRATCDSQDVCATCINDEFGSGVTATDFGRADILKEHTEDRYKLPPRHWTLILNQDVL